MALPPGVLAPRAPCRGWFIPPGPAAGRGVGKAPRGLRSATSGPRGFLPQLGLYLLHLALHRIGLPKGALLIPAQAPKGCLSVFNLEAQREIPPRW
jgi:hypothetical protein